MSNVVSCLDKGWRPLDEKQNSSNETDVWKLLEQFNRAWKFRESMDSAFKKVLYGHQVVISRTRANIFAAAMEEVLGLDKAKDWATSVFAKRLYKCRTLEQFQQALWGCELIRPGALMAKLFAWCHPGLLPQKWKKEATMESFWLDSVQLPFCGRNGDLTLLSIVKGYKWHVALKYGKIIMKILMNRDPNWWKLPAPLYDMLEFKEWCTEKSELGPDPFDYLFLTANLGQPTSMVPPSSVDPKALELMQMTFKGSKKFQKKGNKKKTRNTNQSSTGGQGTERDYSKFTCYACGAKGHIAKYCPQKDEQKNV